MIDREIDSWNDIDPIRSSIDEAPLIEGSIQEQIRKKSIDNLFAVLWSCYKERWWSIRNIDSCQDVDPNRSSIDEALSSEAKNPKQSKKSIDNFVEQGPIVGDRYVKSIMTAVSINFDHRWTRLFYKRSRTQIESNKIPI